MFDQIHFIEERLSVPITEHNYAQMVEHYYGKYYSQDTSMDVENGFAMNGVFYVDGKLFTCPYHPKSPYSSEHLFYIQAFSILEAGAHYFTRRSNLNSYLLLFTLEGEGILEYEGKTYSLSQGMGFFIDCRKTHFYKTVGVQWKHADLHIDGGYINLYLEKFSDDNNYVFHFNNNVLSLLEELVTINDELSPFRDLIVSSKLDSFLCVLLSESKAYKNTLEKFPDDIRYLVRYMENNYMQHLTLDFLSDFSGISIPHLIRLFNTYIGCTPKEYIIQLQLENAKKLLVNSTFPANKIGALVGIENESYFGYLFKKRSGMSPGEYRKTFSNT